MADQKIIAVVGATGMQGGGLVRALANEPDGAFKARVLTRNVSSAKAKTLASLGVEIVTADLDDLAGLQRAFAGAYGAFCVTNFWEHLSPEKELAQATNLAEASKRAGLQHVIWSTLEDTRRWVPLSDNRMPTPMAKYKVPHFDAKGEAYLRFADLGVPTTFLLTSLYWDNLIYFGMGPKKGPIWKNWPLRFQWATRNFPVSRPRISAGVCSGSSKGNGNLSERLSGSPANISLARRWPWH